MDEVVFGEMLKEASAAYETAVRAHYAGGKALAKEVQGCLSQEIRRDLLAAVTATMKRHGIPAHEWGKCHSRLCSEIGQGDAVARWRQPALPFST